MAGTGGNFMTVLLFVAATFTFVAASGGLCIVLWRWFATRRWRQHPARLAHMMPSKAAEAASASPVPKMRQLDATYLYEIDDVAYAAGRVSPYEYVFLLHNCPRGCRQTLDGRDVEENDAVSVRLDPARPEESLLWRGGIGKACLTLAFWLIPSAGLAAILVPTVDFPAGTATLGAFLGLFVCWNSVNQWRKLRGRVMHRRR